MSLRKSQSEHWKNGKDLNTINSYWTSPPATQRSKWFVEQLKDYEFNSIFEVGCFAGRNCRYIKEAFPKVKLGALEINPKAVRFAREKLNMDSEIVCMDLHDMHKLPNRFDVVFSSGVLIHVPPADIPGVLCNMLNMSSKYVMHLEECGNGEVIKGPKHMKPKKRESDQVQWAPDLVGLYRQQGFTPTVIPLPETTQTNGAKELIIIDKEQK